jgi:single-strand DNA-binding protein
MNTVVLTGNLGSDPESFFTPNDGVQVVNFPLAFQSGKRDKTNWIRITAFNKNAEVAERYLHKGARVGIIGTLELDQWETEEGDKRSAMKLIARSIEFIKTDGRGFDQDGNPDEEDIPI